MSAAGVRVVPATHGWQVVVGDAGVAHHPLREDAERAAAAILAALDGERGAWVRVVRAMATYLELEGGPGESEARAEVCALLADWLEQHGG